MPGSRRPLRSRERGLAMVAVLTLITLMSAYLIASALNQTVAEVKHEYDQATLQSLRQAKAALIAWAISWNSTQPGALPCPDNDNDGSADLLSGNACPSYIGRLPWKTLGAGDLRDASGERLWYALSSNFRKLSYPGFGGVYTRINGDTTGQLSVTGTAPASNVIAVILAPGAALSAQSRTSANATSAAHYLEGVNAGGTGVYTTAVASDTFNDTLMVVAADDLFAALEPVVAARIERDVKPYLTTYYQQWGYDATWSTSVGALPFPARFDLPDPGTTSSTGTASTRAQSAYSGDTAYSYGLLPVTASASYAWTGSGSVTKVGSPLLFTPSTPCTSASGWRCDFLIVGTGSNTGSVTVRVQGTVSDAGTTVAAMPAASSVTVRQCTGFSTNCVTPFSFSSASLKGRVAADGTGTVAYEGTYAGCAVFCVLFLQVTIPNVTASALTSPSGSAGWFISNEWFRQTYYAVSPSHQPGGSGSCSANGNCLSVNSMPPYYASPANDKRALLVLAGRSINGTSRPASTLANYLEGQNSTPADRVYEHRAGAPPAVDNTASYSINDRVVVVSP